MLKAVIGLGCSLLTIGVTHTKCAWNPGGFFWGPPLTLTGRLYSSDDCWKNKSVP